MLSDRMFLTCEKCGKRLIERQSNGLFYFIFGRKKDKTGKLYEFCPVEMFIYGSIKMRCLSRECNHWNIFEFFPKSQSESTN